MVVFLSDCKPAIMTESNYVLSENPADHQVPESRGTRISRATKQPTSWASERRHEAGLKRRVRAEACLLGGKGLASIHLVPVGWLFGWPGPMQVRTRGDFFFFFFKFNTRVQDIPSIKYCVTILYCITIVLAEAFLATYYSPHLTLF